VSTIAELDPKIDRSTINLFDVGCILNLKIHSWSARKMLTRADMVRMGYNPDNLPQDVVNLGRKLMVPKAEILELNRIEQRARKHLIKYSVPFGIASAHFVPIKMLPTVEQQLEEARKDFFDRVDKFIAKFEEMKTTIRERYPEFWDKCLKTHYPANPSALRRYYVFEWHVFKIAGIDSIERSTAEELIAQQQVQEEKKGEMRRQMQSQVCDFVGEYVFAMRQETIRFCDLITARINGKPFGDESEAKQLSPRAICSFRKYINKFMDMNIFEDNEIEKMLVQFRDTYLDIGVGPTSFESATVKSSVTQALAAIRTKACTEGESSSKFVGELKRRIVV